MNSHFFRIAYLGYSSKMLDKLCQNIHFDVVLAVYVPKRVDMKFLDNLKKYNVEGIPIETKPNFEILFENYGHFDAIIMHQFEYILPESFVKKYVIINFHRGDLRTNRGAHSLVWSILRGDRKTCFSMYQLTGGIDEGLLIGEYWVTIEETDTTVSVDEKLQCGIPDLFQKLKLFLDGKIEPKLVMGGKYLPKIKEIDYTIDAMEDSFKIIKQKINSQSAYLGAVIYIDHIKYRVMKYKETEGEEMKKRIVSFSGMILRIQEHKDILILFCERNKRPVVENL